MTNVDEDVLRRFDLMKKRVAEAASPAVKDARASWDAGNVTVEDARKAAQAAVDTVKLYLPSLENLSNLEIGSIEYAFHTAALCWESAIGFTPIVGDKEQAVLDAWDDARDAMGIALESLHIAWEVTKAACAAGMRVNQN